MKDNSDINFIKILFWKWWRNIDQLLFIAVAILISFSLLLVTTAGSSVAGRIGASDNFFSNRHMIYMFVSFVTLIILSGLSLENIKRIGITLFILNIALLIAVKFIGYEVKGAKRWINILGFSLQPSEFIKPTFAIFTAAIFTFFMDRNKAFIISLSIFMFISALLVLQPDLGMIITITGIWGVQLFIAGLPLIWIFISMLFLTFGMFFAYMFLPHVTQRIDSFLDPKGHDNYQVSQSLKAFKNGGLFGKGPGEGVVKYHIPDSHSDFIFSVAGEEFGIVVCIFISLVFAFIVIKAIIGIVKKDDEFVILASTGIITQFALQSIINMGVSLNMVPTKGMTLPFVSYGGSSTIAVGISIGMLLALLQKRQGATSYNIIDHETRHAR